MGAGTWGDEEVKPPKEFPNHPGQPNKIYKFPIELYALTTFKKTYLPLTNLMSKKIPAPMLKRINYFLQQKLKLNYKMEPPL